MKKTTVLGISSNSKLIAIFDDPQNFIETKFEGFEISSDLRLRPYFDELLNKEIECSFNKTDKSLRYQNESFFTKLLQAGALSVNQKELSDSKLHSSEKKKSFTQISQQQDSANEIKILNDKQYSSLVQNLIKQNKWFSAKIQYLHEYILLRFVEEQSTYLLQCKINNCKHYFQLFAQTTFWKNKALPVQVQFKITGQKYNLADNQRQIEVSFKQQIIKQWLSQGWIALDTKKYHHNSVQSFKSLVAIQNQSIKSSKGIYSSKSQILSFIYAKNNYVGVVTNIIEGYIYEITSLKTQEVGKVQLPMVVCPVGEDTGSFECRQFARKQLIGKEVNVYLHKQEGLNTTGNIVRIQDWKDIQSVLLENGFANVREEYKSSILGQKYTVLENKAKQKKKGIHKKDIGNKRLEDLTQAPFNKSHLNLYLHRRMQVLSKLNEKQQVVIQKIISAANYQVRVESLHLLINLKLDGVLEPCFNPNLKEYSEIKSQAEKFLKRHFYQRTMIGTISDYDEESNSFIGTLKQEKSKTDMQEILIEASLVYADNYNFVSRYHDLQEQAKKSEKLIWQPQLRCFEPGFELNKEKFCFQGRFSWIKDGKIAFVQPNVNYVTIEKIEDKIRSVNLAKLPKDLQKIGAWCAAPYQGQLYRAVIKSKKDHQATVQFFDWGNQEIVKVDELRQLPEEFLYLEKQCIKVTLNLVASTKNKDALQKVRQMLFEGGNYVFKKVHGDFVDFFAAQITSVNEQLIVKGLLKADKDELKRYEKAAFLKNTQQELRKEGVGIWQESDSSEEQIEQY